jgi:hypothetical protein
MVPKRRNNPRRSSTGSLADSLGILHDKRRISFGDSSSTSSIQALTGPRLNIAKSHNFNFNYSMYNKDSNALNLDKLDEKDLNTMIRQMKLFRLQLQVKITRNKITEEHDILHAWQVVYDAEEEAFNLKAKCTVAYEMINIHERLEKMVFTLFNF